jgi:hypothetical protein
MENEEKEYVKKQLEFIIEEINRIKKQLEEMIKRDRNE